MNNPQPSRLGPFGDVYIAGDANTEVIADTVVEINTKFGFVSQRTTTEHTVRITGTQSARWHRIIAGALPQRLEWRVWATASDAVVQFDRQSLGWYRVLVLTACGASAIWLWAAFLAGINGMGSALAVAGVNVLGAIGLLTLAARWALAGGSGTIDRMWDALHERLASRGIRLDHRPELSRSRLQQAGTRLLAFVIAVAGLLVVAVAYSSLPAIRRAPPWLGIAVLLLIVIAAVMCWILIRGTRRPGFEQRFRMVLPGLCGLFFMVFLIAGQFPVYLLTRYPTDAWQDMFAARDLLQQVSPDESTVTSPSGKTVPTSQLREVIATVKVILAMPLFIIPFGAIVGALAFIPTLRLLGVLVRHSGRLSSAADLATVRSAVSGRGFMGRFRASLILCWGIASVLVLWGITGLAITAGKSSGLLGPVSSNPDVASVTAHAIRFVFDLNPHNLAVEVVARWFWCTWAWMMMALLALSTGSWVRRRRAVRRELRRLERQLDSDAAITLRSAISGLSAGGGSIPHVALRPDSSPRAASFEFGLLRRKQFIVVSDSCLRFLTTEELAAVIAHEWSHLVLGHCRKHNVLQLLGRVTFVGDSFVNALEHSFRYELEADRCAVARFRARPDCLRSCLLKLRAVATLQRLRHVLPATGSAGLGVSDSGFGTNLRPRRLLGWSPIIAFRLWLRLYTGDTTTAYWHPAIDDRIQNLA